MLQVGPRLHPGGIHLTVLLAVDQRQDERRQRLAQILSGINANTVSKSLKVMIPVQSGGGKEKTKSTIYLTYYFSNHLHVSVDCFGGKCVSSEYQVLILYR